MKPSDQGPRRALGLAALLVALTATGCGSTARLDAEQEARPAEPVAADAPEETPTAAPSMADLEALYWARQDSAHTRYTDADVHFMTGMIGHHAQALVMSAMAPTHGASPAVQRLAARIINAQRDEIATMQRWLEDRGQPVPEIHIEGTTLMIHGAGHHHDHTAMPGMLSDAQMAELDAARGAAFDRLFLTYMIQHHGGAVVMVDDLFAADGAAQDAATFKLASDIQVDQRTEIARMQQMLDALSDSTP